MDKTLEWVMSYGFTKEQAKKCIEEATNVANATGASFSEILNSFISVVRWTTILTNPPLHLSPLNRIFK